MQVRRHRLTTRVMAVACVALITGFVASCGDDDSSAGTTFAITAERVGKARSLEFPAKVKAGLVTMTLTNKDTVARSAQILRLEGDYDGGGGKRVDYTVDDVLSVTEDLGTDEGFYEWMQDGGGFGDVEPGAKATVTQVLSPGKWAIWGGMYGPGNEAYETKGEFTVTGPASDAELPSQPATLTATDKPAGAGKKYGFEFKGLKAGTNHVRFENTGQELHEANIFRMRTGVTIDEVKAAYKAFKGVGSKFFVGSYIDTAMIDAGIAQNITLELTPGRYAAVCFLPDRDGSDTGEVHATKGMVDELAIE